MIDITGISFGKLLGAAAKAEENSREVYDFLAKNAKTFVTADRFKFLAGEEQKHEEYVRGIYAKTFGGKELNVPDDTPLPIPFIIFGEESDESELIEQAMEAELAAKEVYESMAKLAGDEGHEEEIVRTLEYLAGMEQNHYNLLESELDRAKNFEEFDEYFPGMHIGP